MSWLWNIFATLNRYQKTRSYKLGITGLSCFLLVGFYIFLLSLWKYHTDPEHLMKEYRGEIVEDWGIFTPFEKLMHTPGLELQAGLIFTLVAFVLITLTWTGVGISAIGILLGAVVAGVPMMAFEPTETIGRIIIGIAPLVLIFVTLLEVARMVFAGAGPTAAIARNVLNEAVRMKISMVFVGAMLLLLAFLPQYISPDQELRYRVQQWLAWGTGASFFIASLMTLFFSCSTVCFEQRDRTIWQTMTKPVAAWRYVLGKWLGVMTLNVILLGVMAGGVYMFTEYLVRQPASGEIAKDIPSPFATMMGEKTRDRFLLEQQVLTARTEALPEPVDFTRPELLAVINAEVTRRVEEYLLRNPETAAGSQLLQTYRDENRADIIDTITKRSRTIFQPELVQRGDGQLMILPPPPTTFEFTGFGAMRERIDTLRAQIDDLRTRFARASSDAERERIQPRLAKAQDELGSMALTLRYKIESGSNDPEARYSLLFRFNGDESTTVPRTVPLDQYLVMEINPQVVLRQDGTITLDIASDLQQPIPFSARIPPDGLTILVPVGGYELNFLRVIAAMLVKLGFLSAVAIAASTMVSFPVACMLALVFWFAAESSASLFESLDYFDTGNGRDGIKVTNTIAYYIARPVSWALKTYAELRPTDKLTDGRLISWAELAVNAAIIFVWSLLALVVGVFSLRKRELALYSGK